MAELFRLRHVDGAPLLVRRGEAVGVSTQTLGESLRLLDIEPVIIVDLTDSPSLDAETRSALFGGIAQPGATLIVIARSGTLTAASVRIRDGTSAMMLVDSITVAAVRAAQIHHRRVLRETPGSAGRRFRVRAAV